MRSLSDDELLARLSSVTKDSRRVESVLVAHIAEVDLRRLYAREAFPSMFKYAVDVLHLSEAEAYFRITAARASRRFPVLLSMLETGRLHLSAIEVLAPHLTEANSDALLARAVHKTKREIKELVAEIAPKPDVPPSVRKVPERWAKRAKAARESTSSSGTPASTPSGQSSTETPPAAAPARKEPDKRQVVEPLSPARYKVQFTASTELRDKLRRLEALMQCDLADVIETAVTEKLERLEASRYAKTKSTRKTLAEIDTASTGSRYMPAAVKRAVCARDRNQCTFVDASGRRCQERDRLEFHHDDPYGKGGNRSIENIRLLCKTHNLYLAEREYGKDVMDAFRRSADRVSEPMPTYSVWTEFQSESPAHFGLRGP